MNKSGIKKKILILENIRSVHNVGAIFRTADAIGIDKIYLIGYTPAPIDRFGRARKDIHKAALGAEENIEWEHLHDKNAVELVEKLKKDGVKTIAIEQSENSIDYKKVSDEISGDVAILVGNEVEGVEDETLYSVDFIAEIPMKGEKESLNVSVATGVALYGIFDRGA
jgi:23S rRNA (guanosine2251-2'-O)-methyltransferase